MPTLETIALTTSFYVLVQDFVLKSLATECRVFGSEPPPAKLRSLNHTRYVRISKAIQQLVIELVPTLLSVFIASWLFRCERTPHSVKATARTNAITSGAVFVSVRCQSFASSRLPCLGAQPREPLWYSRGHVRRVLPLRLIAYCPCFFACYTHSFACCNLVGVNKKPSS